MSVSAVIPKDTSIVDLKSPDEALYWENYFAQNFGITAEELHTIVDGYPTPRSVIEDTIRRQKEAIRYCEVELTARLKQKEKERGKTTGYER